MVRTIIQWVGLLMVAGTLQAQQTLAEMADEVGVSWLIGEWAAQTDRDNVQLAFSWDLGKRVAQLHLKTNDMESKGMIGLDAASREVKYAAFDNRGGCGTGVWSNESQTAILKYTGSTPDGEQRKMGLKFTKVSADAMRVEVFGLTAANELDSSARATIEFKRKSK